MKTHFRFGTLLITAAIVCSTSMSATAYGQWYSGGYGGAGYGLNLGRGGGFSAQTPYSANATGMGNLIRSEGEYNVLSSKAAINYEQARSVYIDNQQKAFSARQSMKRVAKANDIAENEAAHAALARADEFIAAHQPLPLPNSQLNPSTGNIEWPVGLSGKDFDEGRKSLDGMFESRMKSGATAALASEIEKKTCELKDALREHITKMPLKDYSEARRFLDSMYASAR